MPLRSLLLKILIASLVIFGTYLTLSFYLPQNQEVYNFSTENSLISMGRKRQYLSHLVIPLHIKQKDRVREYFEFWKTFPPCPLRLENRFKLFTPKLAEKIKMVLQVSSEQAITKQDHTDLFKYYHQEGIRSECIESIEVKELIIKNDTYLVGSRVMFESMLSNELGLVDPAYIFYMEPDCKPIRPGWLQAVDATIRWPNAHFWMKGSPFRGKPTPNISAHLIVRSHINGNAIYNLGDPAFFSFYNNTVKPFIKKKFAIYGAAYDLDFFRLFYNSSGEFYHSFQHIITKFQYSEIIQNYWHSVYKVRDVLEKYPETYIIHGGKDEID